MSHNEIEHPTDGRDIEAKADELEKREYFMHGVRAADHARDCLSTRNKATKFAWGVIFLLQSLGVEMEEDVQYRVLSNIKQLFECLTTESQSPHD